ncbi:MAG: FtsX-like permease family protein [Chitinispirillaceae bacterium]
MLVKLSTSGKKVSAETIYSTELMDNHHGGVILHEGHVYGSGSYASGWFCLDLMSGKQKWNSRGKGSLTYADGMLYCLDAFRMKDGDDASCTNLNRVSTPSLVATNPKLLDSLDCFSFASVASSKHKEHPWLSLESSADENTFYGIADQNSIEWILGKSTGDTLANISENGEPLNIILAAGLENSVLHGNVIISEKNFIRHFPSISGYRLFLAAAPQGKEMEIGKALNTISMNEGGYFVPTTKRLQAVNSVTNTYLSIFSLLGLFGLLSGCLGLAIVFVRTLHERRFELATLEAQGFSRMYVQKILYIEYAILCLAGIFSGIIPAMLISGTSLGIGSCVHIAVLLIIVLTAGLCSVYLGMRISLRSSLLYILREKNDE